MESPVQKNAVGISFHSPCFLFPCSIHTFHITSHLPLSDQRESVTPVSASVSQETSAHLESTAILESTVHLPIETYKMEGNILRTLLAFHIGQHSLVMFTFMSYMLINHSPSLTL